MLFRVEQGGVPNRHAAEVRPIWIRVADSLNNGQLAGVEQLSRIGQRRVQSNAASDLDEPVFV